MLSSVAISARSAYIMLLQCLSLSVCYCAFTSVFLTGMFVSVIFVAGVFVTKKKIMNGLLYNNILPSCCQNEIQLNSHTKS